MANNFKQFNITYQAYFTSKKGADLYIWLAQPGNFPCQQIKYSKISPQPNKIYLDDQSNVIAFLKAKNIKNFSININLVVKLYKKNINLKKSTASKFNKSLFRFIKSEKFLEQIPMIKKLTFQLVKDKKTLLEKLKSIFNFITTNFTYRYPVKNRGVKNLNLHNLKGDCGEYSALFVTMCRILKIPAKNYSGFTIFPKQKRINEHAWAGIYLKPYGWVDMDPTYAALEKNKIGVKKYFCQRSDYRVAFSNGFNIPLKPLIPKGYSVKYWTKLGLPINKKSAQILQPLVFASKGTVKFKDRIKLT